MPGLAAAQREFISPERGHMLRAKIDDTKVHAPSEYRAEGWALPPLSARFDAPTNIGHPDSKR